MFRGEEFCYHSGVNISCLALEQVKLFRCDSLTEECNLDVVEAHTSTGLHGVSESVKRVTSTIRGWNQQKFSTSCCALFNITVPQDRCRFSKLQFFSAC